MSVAQPSERTRIQNATERWREIDRRLCAIYGQPRHYNPADPLDDLIFVALSRMTQEFKYLPTYQRLRRRFPTWDSVLQAPQRDLEHVLAYAGLAKTKAKQIKAILATIRDREGHLDIRRLKHLPDPDVERYLTTLPGVGTKTAQCVMLYTLGRDVCPVDAHVWRIAQRLGFIDPASWTDTRSRMLSQTIPPGIRGSLHVTLIAHGRTVCHPKKPDCGACALSALCRYAEAPATGSAKAL